MKKNQRRLVCREILQDVIDSSVSSEEGSFDEEKVVEMLGRTNGLKSVGDLYFTVSSYEKDIIE